MCSYGSASDPPGGRRSQKANGKPLSFKILEILLIFFFSAVIIGKTISTVNPDTDNHRLCCFDQNFTHFSLLTSRGTSLFHNKSKFYIFSENFVSNSSNIHHFFGIILLLSGNVELNPGPRQPKYPCGICHKACTWKQEAVACDSCDVWFHKKCMLMNTEFYENLKKCLLVLLPMWTSKFSST